MGGRSFIIGGIVAALFLGACAASGGGAFQAFQENLPEAEIAELHAGGLGPFEADGSLDVVRIDQVGVPQNTDRLLINAGRHTLAVRWCVFRRGVVRTDNLQTARVCKDAILIAEFEGGHAYELRAELKSASNVFSGVSGFWIEDSATRQTIADSREAPQR